MDESDLRAWRVRYASVFEIVHCAVVFAALTEEEVREAEEGSKDREADGGDDYDGAAAAEGLGHWCRCWCWGGHGHGWGRHGALLLRVSDVVVGETKVVNESMLVTTDYGRETKRVCYNE